MLPQDPVNILLVDDHPANISNYEALLKDTGENLIRARSAKKAQEQLLRFDVAVVLINVGMRHSVELCKTIHQDPRCKSTSILLVSAGPITDSDYRKGYDAGATDYISLPVIPELLRAKVALFTRLYRDAAQLEKLRKGAQRKNLFLARLAHELRDPLAPIASAATVLRRKVPSEKELQWFSEVIERQVFSLKKLVDDLLDISRISQNTLVLQREKVDLVSILGAAAREAGPAIKQSGHEFSVELPKEPVLVFGDSIRLTQVFENLLDTSAKFINSGGRISLSAELDGAGVAIRIADESAGVAIRIADESAGIPQGELPQFSEQGGQGVGLSLVWQLVEMHGGSIEVRSGRLGLGSEFMVHLPILGELPVDAGPARSAPGISPLRILIAEDNPDSATALAMSLRLEGHIVEIAHDGIQALEIAETFRPQVALLDIAMPKASGYEVAEQIRSRDWSKDTLLIAQTGWARPEDWEKAVSSGFNIHLTKPLDYAALAKVLDNFTTRAAILSGNKAA
jgi:signal transduction histidine kinase/ActR/RegA family two-component response regulator